MRNLQEFYSERTRDFLLALEKRRLVVYIMMRRRPRSWEYRVFPYKEEVELMTPRSLGYLPYQEGKSHGVGSSCMVRKMFPYKNMHRDHTRPRWICQYAHPSFDGICPHDMKMYPPAFRVPSTQPSASIGVGLKVPDGPFLSPTTPLGIGAVGFIVC